MKGNKILLLLFFIVLATFLIGLVKLFELRFEAGDVYPAYSSLRSDPVGTKAFFESLANFDHMRVRRNYRPLHRAHLDQGSALFFLGARPSDLESVQVNVSKALSQFVTSGGRLVFSFLPEKVNRVSEGKDKPPKPCPERHTSKMGDRFVSLADEWGVTFCNDEETAGPTHAERAIHLSGDSRSDPISWHTSLYFDPLRGPWNVVSTFNGHPVIIERSLGRGSVVLSADSFYLSNEALLKERHTDLLAWLLGKRAQVVFDESHFGIQKRAGIVGLVRKYRLQWLFMGIILLALLFVWKKSVDFVPPPDDERSTGGNDFTSERDFTAGLVSLLRREIPARDILTVCVEEWEKSGPSAKDVLSDRGKRVRAVIERGGPGNSKQQNPVRGYRDICRILSKGNRS